ncbi:hypothetical protein UlMin_019562 [Ulmus minor]
MALEPVYFICFLLPFLIQLSSTAAQTRANISLGLSLTAGDNNLSWESPSGDFAFGFQKIGKDGFLLAIWFSKITESTIVWSANRNDLVQQGSKVHLTEAGLVLNDANGDRIEGISITTPGVAYGAMLDTGNFVLASQTSATLWESFDEPTDTLLPAQTLAQGKELVARYSETNYSSGRYFFRMETGGNLVLFTRTLPVDFAPNFVYWASDTVNSGFELIFNQSGFINLQAKNGTVLMMLTTKDISTKDFYQRAVLEHDGVFQLYVYPKRNDSSSSGWNMGWSKSSQAIPFNICKSIQDDKGHGACGLNSYCTIGDDERPNCDCPDGYSLIDPNDATKGCKQNFEAQSCDEDSWDDGSFYLYSMEKTNFVFSDYEHFTPVSEDWCRKACLRDCFCALAIYGGATCWKKRSPFSNGIKDSTFSSKALIKIRNGSSTSNSGGTGRTGTCSRKKDRLALLIIRSVLLSTSVFLNVLLLLTACVVLWFFKRKANLHTKPNEIRLEMNLRTFSYEELDKATSGFNEQLGSGAFGTVFKGVLPSDQESNLVAIKKLDSMVREGAHEKEFKAEVFAIGHTNHKNLVKLIGFCNEDQHRLLVYEFMSNGSLASLLFRPSRPSWHQRMKIALDTARGLFYLHEECRTQIIHCDIKPQNILLDDSFTARISDFGLAKILKTDQTRTATQIRGTKGYVAPEWFKNMPVSAKVDIYSYGIVLLELICCRKSFEAEIEDNLTVGVHKTGPDNNNQMILADWAYDCYKYEKLDLLVGDDDDATSDMRRVKKYVMVAMWCIQEEPSLRPTMKKVIQMLDGSIQVPIPPDPYSFISSL